MIFDGLARVYSTCRACRELMVVFEVGETVHPCCEQKPTPIEHLPPQLHRAAVYYAKIGWPVFPLRPAGTSCRGGDKCKPLCQCPKTPATHNGFKDATTDVVVVDEFWSKASNHNIGLATGHLFDVIDIDPRHGGVQSFLKLLEEKVIPDIHAVAATASGGMHLYVPPTGRGNHAAVRPGIDYRGLGGYCVAPPSTLGAPERSWSWMTVPSPRITLSHKR
jgi:hypothetical protein